METPMLERMLKCTLHSILNAYQYGTGCQLTQSLLYGIHCVAVNM